jgi:alkylation response protein AidB-like acyl-CoA dehydrogenase
MVRLDGSSEFVVNGAQADWLLVHLDVAGEPMLVRVETGPAVDADDRPTLDGTRAQATIGFTAAAGTVLATGDLAIDSWRHAETLAQLTLAAEDVAVAGRCLDLSVEYAGVRVQFGRLIGSYQAIKHKCTDMLIALDLARAAVRDAAQAVEEGRAGADAAVAMARHLGQVAAELATRECIQIHGGIGFTWEHPAHLYFKRARGNAAILSSPGAHLDAFTDLVLATHPRSI